MKLQLRPAGAGDLDALAQLTRRALFGQPGGLDCDEPRWRRIWRRKLDDERGCLVAAVDGEARLGYALGSRRGTSGELAWLMVDEAARRRGIGRALTDELVRQFVAAGCDEALVGETTLGFLPGVCEAWPEALAFFEALGFATLPERSCTLTATLASYRVPDGVAEAERALADDGVVVRAFEPTDLPSLQQLLAGEFIRFGSSGMLQHPRENLARLPGELTVAARGDSLVGFVAHVAVLGRGNLGAVAVTAELRRRKLAFVMLAHAMEALRRREVADVHVWAGADSPLIARTWPRLGFEVTGLWRKLRRPLP